MPVSSARKGSEPHSREDLHARVTSRAHRLRAGWQARWSARGFERDDLIVGVIYVGADVGGLGTRSRRTFEEFVQSWTGGSATLHGT
jgi:hypothetical protein